MVLEGIDFLNCASGVGEELLFRNLKIRANYVEGEVEGCCTTGKSISHQCNCLQSSESLIPLC